MALGFRVMFQFQNGSIKSSQRNRTAFATKISIPKWFD